MKILVFDTETTGLPKGYNPSILETDKWPHIIQLSFIVYDTDSRVIVSIHDNIVSIDDSVELTEDSVKMHNITRERSKQEGLPIKALLKTFNIYLQNADLIVGHNVSFDKRIIMVESIRNNIKQHFTVKNVKKQEYCTMKNSVDLCKIERTSSTGNTYYKYPNLSELYNKLFDVIPCGVHNSLVDILVCLRCYIKLTENYDVLEVENIRELFEKYSINH
jgi:DNA polymerase-3 subunit epsilon